MELKSFKRINKIKSVTFKSHLYGIEIFGQQRHEASQDFRLNRTFMELK